MDNDIDNVLIILQMLEINDFAALEQLKKDLALEEDDDVLSSEEELKKEKEKIEESLKKASAKCERTHAVIESILAQPAEFWNTKNVSSFANSLLGTIIIPEDKNDRSVMAGGILFGIIKSKNKDLVKDCDGQRKGLIAILKNTQKQKRIETEIIK
jgi:hypothetical protein